VIRLTPNLRPAGRLLRGLLAVALFATAFYLWPAHGWPAALIGIAALFVLFEALRGWCILRACGLKTRF